jgi:acid phosphatase
MSRVLVPVLVGLVALVGCSSSGGGSTPPPPAPSVSISGGAGTPTASGRLPHPAHVVVVVMENHAYSQVISSTSAPYINSLAAQGASFSHSYAVTHPSEPNYLALFSGSTQGIADDSCPHTFPGANLGEQLRGAGKSFAGFSEGLPSSGYQGCVQGGYARKHNPWVNFPNVPASANLGFDQFPTNYSTLPTVSFVIPDLCNDMHDCPVATGDSWLKKNLGDYVGWAKSHGSILLLTWDEDDNGPGNHIPTIIVGAGVKAGTVVQTINHYTVLRTLEDMYSLPHAGASASVAPITDAWS